MSVVQRKLDFSALPLNYSSLNFTALRLTIYAATVAVIILALTASHLTANAAQVQYVKEIQLHKGETVGVATYRPSNGTGLPAQITYSFDVVGIAQVFTDNRHNSNPAEEELANATYNTLDNADRQVLIQTGEAAVLIVYDSQDPTINMTQYQFDHQKNFGLSGLYLGMALVWYMFVAPMVAVFLSRESRESFNPLTSERPKRANSKWWVGNVKAPNYFAGALLWLFGAVFIYGAFAWNMSSGSRLSIVPIGLLLLATPWLTLNGTLRGIALVSFYFAAWCVVRPVHGAGLLAIGIFALFGGISWLIPTGKLKQLEAFRNRVRERRGN